MVNIDRLKILAHEQGIKLGFLAQKIGVPHTYFADIKSKQRDMPDSRLLVIADILNTTPEYLRDETEVKEKPSTNSEEVSVNTVIMRSRDGSIIKRHLSDEQVRALQTIIGQLPDTPDDL